MQRVRIVRLVACAACALSLAACERSKGNRVAATADAAHPSYEDRCEAQIPGMQVSSVDTDDGARVSYSAPPGNIEALRHALDKRMSTLNARASGGSPPRGAPVLPPSEVDMEPAPGGALITFRAEDPADVGRVRDLVRWDIKRMQRGYCSALQFGPQKARASGGQPLSALTRTGVVVEPLIAQICGLSPDESAFQINTADLRPRAHPMLDNLSECLTDGKLAGRRVRITGRADPRGTDEYNLAVGKSRAQSVADYLSEDGVLPINLIVVPTGPEEATGTDEHGWALDHRVDIALLP